MEMSSIVVREPGGEFRLWRFRPLDELGLKEGDLESAIVAQPKALVVDPLELLAGDMAAYSQTVLSFGNSTRRPDVVVVTDHGDVIVVEVKRLINAELRKGRHAIAQVVEYASLLSSASEADLVSSLTNGSHSSWDDLCHHELGHSRDPRRLAKVVRHRIREGEIHLVIACEQAPADLADLVRTATNSKALAFALHVVEVRPMVPKGQFDAEGPIAWVPWPRLDTEIVHRTSVTVRAEGFDDDKAPAIHVEFQNDSGREVEERVTNSSRPARARRDRKLEAQHVLTPLAEGLGLTVEHLWDELGAFHRAVEGEDWSDLTQAIAQPNDEGPNQRGANIGEGRYGVNLLAMWQPSVFVGAYLRDHDHKQSLLAPHQGGDFALILDVWGKRREREDFANHQCVGALRERLRENAGEWSFADHHAQPNHNSWHPLYLRRPLQDVIGGTQTLEERKGRWLAAVHDAVTTLLHGGELAELHRQTQ